MAAHGLYAWDVAPNWAKIRFDRMRRVLRAKFSQHEDLQDLLLSTDSARLVECPKTNSAINRTWGEVNGKGLNMQGVLLMEVRSEFLSVRKAIVLGNASLRCQAVPAGQTKNKDIVGQRRGRQLLYFRGRANQ